MKIKALSYNLVVTLMLWGCTPSSTKFLTTNQYSFNNKSILLITPMTNIEILKNKKEPIKKEEIEALNQEVGINISQITDSFFMRRRIKLDKYQYDEVDDYLPLREILEYHKKLTTSKSGNPTNYSKTNLKKIL